MRSVIDRGKCRDCGKPVIWGRLQNGRYRTFHGELVKASEVSEKERFALRKGAPALIDLEGIKHDPTMEVLTPHYCVEYRQRREMRGIESFGDMLPPRVGPSGSP